MLLYDWLSITSKIDSIQTLKETFGLEKIDNWESGNGFNGYKDRLYYEGISIHFNGHKPDMGIWIELSGKGCRTFENQGHGNYDQIFQDVIYHKDEMNITRLDIAFDDREGIFSIEKLVQDTLRKNFISKWNKYECIIGNEGCTINHGSKSSEAFVRIYDKAMEQGKDTHWIRFELQLRQKRARKFIELQQDLGVKFIGVINNYIRYVIPDKGDSNNRRWKNKPYWDKFITTAEKISLYEKQDMDYDIVKVENYVMKQAGNSIDTLLQCKGPDYFFKKLSKRGTTLNERQRLLINKHLSDLNKADKISKPAADNATT